MFSGCSKKSTGTVSYRLLNKKIIEDHLDKLTRYNKRVSVTDLFSELFQVDNRQVLLSSVSRIKQTAFNDADGHRFVRVTNLLSVIGEIYSGEGFVLNEIMNLAKSPEITKEVKVLFLSFLVDIGLDEETIAGLFDLNELAEMAEFATDNLIGFVRGDLSDKLLFLQEFSGFDDMGREEIMKQLVEDNSDAASEMLGILAYSYDTRVAAKAINLLGINLKARKMSILYELTSSDDRFISSLARRVVLENNKDGRYKPSRRKWVRPFTDLYDVVITSMDGKGNRAIWLAWKIPNRKNRIVALNLLLNTEIGIKECFGIPVLTRIEFENMVTEITRSATVLRGDYEYCLTIIRDALNKNIADGYPVPLEFAFWRRCLGNEMYVLEYLPVINDVIPNSEKQIQDSYDRLELLFEEQEFAVWYEETPEVYDAAEEIITLKGRRRGQSYTKKVMKLENLIINRVIKPRIPEIKERLIMTIDFLKKAGKQNLAQEAVVCLVTLDSVPAEQHPFIRRMCFESISAAVNNLRNGIDIRIDPDLM